MLSKDSAELRSLGKASFRRYRIDRERRASQKMLCDTKSFEYYGLMKCYPRAFLEYTVEIKGMISKLSRDIRVVYVLVVILTDIKSYTLHKLGDGTCFFIHTLRHVAKHILYYG